MHEFVLSESVYFKQKLSLMALATYTMKFIMPAKCFSVTVASEISRLLTLACLELYETLTTMSLVEGKSL